MIELLAGTAALLSVLFVAAVVFAVSYRRERDDYRDLHETNSKFQAGTIEILSNRVETLRNDNIALEKQVYVLRAGHDRLVDERDLAVRELGRLKAENVAAKPKRGPNGRFVSKKPQPSKPKPVACG